MGGDPNDYMSIFQLSFKNYPANIYLFKVNNRNTKKWCEIFSKLTIKIIDVILVFYC